MNLIIIPTLPLNKWGPKHETHVLGPIFEVFFLGQPKLCDL